MIERESFVERIITLALEEDLGSGDVTTRAVVDPEERGRAALLAKQEVVLAGLLVFERVFHRLSGEITLESYYAEGDQVSAGSRVCKLEGPLAPILSGERTALNFLQRMSGVATLTRQYVSRVSPWKVKILDTRKTAPGLRWLDKYAVRVGGGDNHRFGLCDGILIKDNHIAAAGSVDRAVRRARAAAPHTLRVEVEVEDMTGLDEALEAGADVILLDNMAPKELRRAVERVDGRALLEASGGIELDTVESIAETGVDFISVGALTHSAKAADFSLEIDSL